MKKEKLCVDCIYHVTIPQPRNRNDDHLCNFFRVNNKEIDLVTGEEIIPDLISCYKERTISGGCSIAGLNFEKKTI